MAGNVDKTQYEKYEKLAVFIMPYVLTAIISCNVIGDLG